MTSEDLKKIAEDLTTLQHVIKGQVLSVEIQYPSGAATITLMEDEAELELSEIY